MRKLVTLLLFTGIIFGCNKATDEKTKTSPEPSKPELVFGDPSEVGLNSDSLEKINDMIMRYVDDNKFPGAVVLIAKEGKIVFEKEVGWSDSLRNTPYRKDHLFRMASMTKPFVSVAAMKLYEEGKLDLNDPVSKYIPEFKDPTVLTSFNNQDTTWQSEPATNEPTVHNLLTHTAGVPYGFMNPQLNGAILAKYKIPDLASHKDFILAEKMAALADLPLIHHPGERWMYGLNTDVLGRVVEVAADTNLADYVHSVITEPLGMEDTKFFFDDTYKDRLADVYISDEQGTISYLRDSGELYHPDYPVYGAKSYFSGGSGLTATARDYYLFCQMMLNDGSLGNVQILKPETAQMMHTNQIDTIAYPWGPFKFGYGFDIALEEHPLKAEGTYSWGGAFKTTFWIDPENELIAIMLSQVLFSPVNDMEQEFEKIVYSAVIEEEIAME